MSFDPFPPKPTNLGPADNATVPDTTTTVPLSWSAAVGPGVFVLRVTDFTEPEVRHFNNLNQNSFALSVQAHHAYSWTVYQVNGNLWSEPATASFRVGDADGAEIVSVTVPEIIEPGATVQAYVTVRNAGSKTWTPELGYKLGSQAPQDNTTWGVNRVSLNTASQIKPGQSAGFQWTLHAPPTPGGYIFQWRMVKEGAYWFGARTRPRYLQVKHTNATVEMLVKRDLGSGLLKRPAGDTITLRGGNYHVFEKDSRAQRKLVISPQDTDTLKEYQDVTPCPGVLPNSTLVTWSGDPWDDLFTTLGSDNNLLRVFMMNGFGIKKDGANENADELYPFKLVASPAAKWSIKNAITAPTVAGNWNDAYFTRLKAFAEKARSKGVFLQLSLFNYYELSNAAWNISIWNPARSDVPNWGPNNLVNPPPLSQQYSCSDGGGDTDEGRRHCYFIEPPSGSGLRNTQEQMVRKVVRELAGKPNIIFEVMNEPHRGSHQTSALFASQVIDWIISEGQKQTPAWRPLISVNAFRQGLDPSDSDKSDVDWWGDPDSNPTGPAYVKNYEEVDIISYHGLTAYPTLNLSFQCGSAQTNADFYRVDMGSIRNRVETFRIRHPSKALMMSTDAVRVAKYTHRYGANSTDLSDGQITTNLNNIGATTYDQLVRSDLENWADWCFNVANAMGTAIHFQNHSNFEATYKRIHDAYRASLFGK